MASPNVSPAAFGLPAGPRTHRYAKAIVAMYNDMQDCWPCDDPVGSTSLRNLVAGGNALDTFANSGAPGVFPGQPSVLGGDPYGKAVRIYVAAAWHAAAYTMPAAGTIEVLVNGLAGMGTGGDSSLFGNWNGSGIMVAAVVGGPAVRLYKDGTFTTLNPVPTNAYTPTQHWAVTWDGTIERLYINGVQRTSQNVGSPAAGGYFGLGVYSSAIHGVSGTFAWLTVYKRALAAGEIAAHAALVTQPS